MSFASAIRSGSLRLRWVAGRGWSWVTLRPGTRPRRAMRRLTEGSIDFVLARPRLARSAKAVLRLTPRLAARLHRLKRQPQAAADLSRRGREILAMIAAAEARRRAAPAD